MQDARDSRDQEKTEIEYVSISAGFGTPPWLREPKQRESGLWSWASIMKASAVVTLIAAVVGTAGVLNQGWG